MAKSKLFLKNSTGQSLKNSSGQFIYKSLPATYQEVEYLQNTSSGYINTGIAAAGKLFKIELQFMSNSSRQLMGISGSSSAYWGNDNGTWEKVGNSGSVSISARCIVNYDVGNITTSKTNTWIEGSTTKYVGSDANYATASANPLRVFNLAGSGYACLMKLYNIKVYSSNDNLINYLIPCYRKSDNVKGMYDLVTSTFIAATGTLVAGADI